MLKSIASSDSEDDVVTPAHYRALSLGVGPQMWAASYLPSGQVCVLDAGLIQKNKATYSR